MVDELEEEVERSLNLMRMPIERKRIDGMGVEEERKSRELNELEGVDERLKEVEVGVGE